MKDFVLNDDLLPPFLPTGNFKSNVQVSRFINGEIIPAVTLTVDVEIEMSNDKKGFKIF